MGYVQNDNTGALFKNDKKEKDTHPNAKGSAVIDGVEYWMSAWTKKDKNGNAFQSIAFKRKDAVKTQEQTKSGEIVSIEDDIPF